MLCALRHNIGMAPVGPRVIEMLERCVFGPVFASYLTPAWGIFEAKLCSLSAFASACINME
jgi:hypothetical protein